MYDGGETTEFQLLLDRWAAGDVAARDRLLERAGQRLLALTRRMLRGYPHLQRWEQTDDVFQSAVLRLYRSLGDVRPESIGQFFGLATTQIRRTLIDLARHHFGPEGAAARHQSSIADQQRTDCAERCGTRACRRAARNARRLGAFSRGRRVAPPRRTRCLQSDLVRRSHPARGGRAVRRDRANHSAAIGAGPAAVARISQECPRVF